MVCHTLPLFGKSPLGLISFDFMIPSLVLCLCSLFPVLSAFTLILSTISHLWNQPSRARSCSLSRHIHGCVTNFIAFIYIYIYIYIQTLAQNRTAVIKMSCSLRSATMVCNHVPKAGGYYCSGVCLYKCTSCWTTYEMYY